MKLLKAILSAVVLYALIFLIASALLFIKNGIIFGSIMVLFAAVLTFLVSKFLYFRGMAVTNAVREGLLLGIIFVVVMFVIEVPVMVYGFAKEMGWNYFLTWHLVVGYMLTLVVPILGAYKGKSKKADK